MKAVLVFDHLSDVIFLNADDRFKEYIAEKAEVVGLMTQLDGDNKEIDPNVVMQMFSPLLASQRFLLEHVCNPYQAIKCEDGLLLIFFQTHDLTYLAINGDQTENEQFLSRKLSVLNSIISFLYGPVLEELHPDLPRERLNTWRFVGQLLDTWCQLYHKEHSFLVEAVERLNVNQILSAKCVELLETSLTQLKNAGKKQTAHALLLGNCKLLSLYSSRHASELTSSDMLLLILLATTLFPRQPRLEEFISQSYSAAASPGRRSATSGTRPVKIGSKKPLSNKLTSVTDEQDGSSDMEYFSTPSTPTLPARQRGNKVQKDTKGPDHHHERAVTVDHDLSDNFYTPIGKPPSPGVTRRRNRQLSDISPDLPSVKITDDKRLEDHTILDQSQQGQVEGCRKITLFLRSGHAQNVPHDIYFIEVRSGITSILISEVARGNLAGPLSDVLSCLGTMLSFKGGEGTNAYWQSITHKAETTLKKLTDLMKKQKGISHLEKLLTSVKAKWDTARKNGLTKCFAEAEIKYLPLRLETLLSSMADNLRELFKLLYMRNTEESPSIEGAVWAAARHVRDTLHTELSDYMDYIAIKTQRNTTITTYLEEFQGLAHFIYVDRSNNHVTAPSFTVSTNTGGTEQFDFNAIVKEKVWEMVPWFQQKLYLGYTSMIVREGDFCFSYFLWFEDPMGNAVQAQKPFRRSVQLPGIISGNFYRRLMEECFPGDQQVTNCYEIICVHMGLAPTQYVLSHCRKLAASMWENSRLANSPISLL